ncbi:unnamed protein product [Lymnaea stagnalis]|uniref:Uncharacterized protein n=1 Tax=Lymnaea stagnalis TaxID=6523 RepID=A0AAV2HMP0_LYMST
MCVCVECWSFLSRRCQLRNGGIGFSFIDFFRMTRWYWVVLISAVVLWWLFQNVRIERTSSLESGASRENIYDFLKNPEHLVKVHPTIVSVFNIVSDHSRVTFQFEDHLPSGTVSMHMSLVYDDEESTLLFQTNSFLANVTVRLQVSDSVPDHSTHDSKIPSTVTIHQTVAVETWRLVSYPLSSFIAGVWESTVKTSLSLLNDATLDVNEDR